MPLTAFLHLSGRPGVSYTDLSTHDVVLFADMLKLTRGK